MVFFSGYAFRASTRTYASHHIYPALPSLICANRTRRQVDKWLSAGNTRSQFCLLASVPDDIFHIILGEISADMHDLITLALTCKTILVTAKPYILEALKAIHAPWAGGRIICLGGCTYENDELPAGFLTGEELNEVTTTSVPEIDSDEDIKFKRYFSFVSQTYRGISNHRRPRVGGQLLGPLDKHFTVHTYEHPKERRRPAGLCQVRLSVWL